jgi:UTP-glucose-1-phosphate uridylyltransferase
MIHALILSRRAERRYGVLPYQEFHEANLYLQVGTMVEKKKPAQRRSN